MASAAESTGADRRDGAAEGEAGRVSQGAVEGAVGDVEEPEEWPINERIAASHSPNSSSPAQLRSSVSRSLAAAGLAPAGLPSGSGGSTGISSSENDRCTWPASTFD